MAKIQEFSPSIAYQLWVGLGLGLGEGLNFIPELIPKHYIGRTTAATLAVSVDANGNHYGRQPHRQQQRFPGLGNNHHADDQGRDCRNGKPGQLREEPHFQVELFRRGAHPMSQNQLGNGNHEPHEQGDGTGGVDHE